MAKGKSVHIEGEVDKIQRVERSELAELVHKALNKSSADGTKVAYFLDEEEDPSMVSDWISTGSTLLDLAISNRKGGGLPVGRTVSFSGLESCVTEDTIIEVIIDMSEKKCPGSVKSFFRCRIYSHDKEQPAGNNDYADHHLQE